MKPVRLNDNFYEIARLHMLHVAYVTGICTVI